MALVGESQAVFLDEPTAGIDVGSRQEILKILEKEKRKRLFTFYHRFTDAQPVIL